MNNFKKLRTEKKITQEKISSDLKISRSNYSRYENGKREPDFKTLKKLADYFNVSIDYLLGREYEIQDKNSIYHVEESSLAYEVKNKLGIYIEELVKDVLSDEQLKQIILIYRSLPENEKQMVLQIINTVIRNRNEK